jgi:REP element-mobilizing transposase RayT
MPRGPRHQLPGGLFHITTRGVRRNPIFLDERDYKFFLGLIEKIAAARGWCLVAYCLMPNHYHLVVETPEADLSAGMHWLNGRYAQWFNLRHGFEGHVFDRRFYSVLVESELHLLELARYVVLNPVRAKICSRPGDWKWSSYRAMVGRAQRIHCLAVDRLGELFGKNRASARAVYEAFVLEGLARAHSP